MVGGDMSVQARLTAACVSITMVPLVAVAAVFLPVSVAGAHGRGVSRLLDGRDTVSARLATACPAGGGSPSCTGALSAPAGVAALAAGTGTAVTVVADGRVLASTLGPVAARRLAAQATSLRPDGYRSVDGSLVAPLAGPGTDTVLVSAPPVSVLLPVLVLALVALLALAGAVAAARFLARRFTRPLLSLADAASRVAAGDLTVRIPVTDHDDVGLLAEAFNAMTLSLRGHVGELQASRDEQRRNLARFGDTLSQTHNLPAILDAILDTAMQSVRAAGGALFLTSADSRYLYLTAGRGLEGRLGEPPGDGDARKRVRFGGDGVTGRVAATGQDLRAVTGSRPGQVQLAEDEPAAACVLSVPLRSGGRVTGVLNLYDRTDGREFDDGDLTTIRTFAGQAAAAIENVLLHHETQRLSVTDGLTGLWNYRYLSTALTREVERASRFGRPLAVLFLDLDRFKNVNDVHGHQRGDAVLLELAGRVRSVVREVDVVARYGGEELVLLLPETDVEGATQLAERIWTEIRRRPFGGLGEAPIPVTTSVGIAVFPVHGQSAMELLRAADSALFRAKDGGRDCWRVAGADDPDGALSAAGNGAA
jgi:two-component system cell cycle response regulator